MVRAHSFTLLKLKDIKLLTHFHPLIPPHIASSFLLSSASDKNQNNWVFANAFILKDLIPPAQLVFFLCLFPYS